MDLLRTSSPAWLCVGVLAAMTGSALEAQLNSIPGATCVSPPPLHCPDTNCSNELIMHPGNATVPKTKRAFFLDYPCDLKQTRP